MSSGQAEVKTLQELRKYDGPLYIQNHTHMKVNVHEDIGEKHVAFELDPAGHPESIAVMPKLALEVRAVQRMWRQGKISVSTDESMEDQITLLMDNAIASSVHARSAMTGLDADGKPIQAQLQGGNQTRDMVEKPCLECGRKNQFGEIVNGRVFQSAMEANRGVPPLCDIHAENFTKWVPRQVQDKKGEEGWEFDKVDLAAPSVQVSVK